MASYTAKVRTDWSPEQAFDYLADFSNVSDWDPSIPRAECVAGSPRELGSRYEVSFEAAGRTFELTYETIEAQQPRRVVLRSTKGPLSSLDTLSFKTDGEGTLVTYDAELSLSGPLAIADPLLQLGFNRAGAQAEEGLKRKLAEPAPSVGSEEASRTASR